MKLKFHHESFYLIAACAISFSAFSQNAGISSTGGTPPNVNAGLDLNFFSQGLLIPRVVLVNTSSFSPLSEHIAGMIIYNTATIGDVNPGFYFNNGSKWVALVPKANTAGDMHYWNGSIWAVIHPGLPGQRLMINAVGAPAWTP